MKLYKFYKDKCEACEKLSAYLSEIDIPADIEIVEKNIKEKDNLHFLKEKGFRIIPVLMFEDGEYIQGLPKEEDLIDFINR